MTSLEDCKIAIIGLGYVGLPLAVEFAKHFPTIGLDTDMSRLAELQRGFDRSKEISTESLAASHLRCTDDPAELVDCTIYIVTVPTPIDEYKRPDLTLLINACRTVAGTLKAQDIVIFESTVYPGATEEICVPELEKHSGLAFNRDFYVGYSPERINPGDKAHTLTTIRKITSGSTPAVAERIDTLYRTIIQAGTHKASSIRVAEAAKVIENTQRDVNIALINELAILFHRLGLNTLEVLEAAGSKWNFLPFRPGLVGGHCIGVDPYYLTYKAQQIGHHSEMILAGRRINDIMGIYVAGRVVKLMAMKNMPVAGTKALVLGLTFKENCTDIRNTRVADLVRELAVYRIEADVYDPWADADEARRSLGLGLVSTLKKGHYDAIIIAVAHAEFQSMSVQAFRELGKPVSVLFDIKAILPREAVDGAL